MNLPDGVVGNARLHGSCSLGEAFSRIGLICLHADANSFTETRIDALAHTKVFGEDRATPEKDAEHSAASFRCSVVTI